MRALASIAVLVLVVGGCGLGEAGMPLPRQQAGQSYPGDRQEFAGVLDVSDFGCFNLAVNDERLFVIWPTGSDYANSDNQYAVRLPGGAVVADGESVIGTGAFTPTAPLLAQRDTSLAYALRSCAPDASEVVVLDTARHG